MNIPVKKNLVGLAKRTPVVRDYYSDLVRKRSELRTAKRRISDLEAVLAILTDKSSKLSVELELLVAEFANLYYSKELLPKIQISHVTNPKKSSKKFGRVLQVNTVDIRGGAAKVASRLQQKLHERKLHSTLLVRQAFSNDPNVIEIRSEDSIAQKYLLEFQGKEGWLDLFHLSTFGIKDLDEFKSADILHLHNLHGNYFNPLALPELTSLKPTIWTLHDMQSITPHCAHSLEVGLMENGFWGCPSLDTYPGIPKDTTKFLCENKAAIYENSNFTLVCPSIWLKSKVEQSILGKFEVKVIYNGIDESLFKNVNKLLAREKLGLPKEKTILLFSADFGIYNPWKGGKYLLDAFEHFKHDPNIIFLNVGGGSNNSHPRWKDVNYVKEEAEMALYYAASNLFVYPTLADNCPLTVLESLSCGTPVITFNTGGVPELVTHMETGYIAEYQNLQDFIKGINTLINDSNLSNGAGLKARKVVESKFRLNSMTDNYINLYNEILQK